MKKYEELNEQSFSEFIKYYNSNIFKHVVENFEIFLAACAKVCVLKKVPRIQTNDEEEKSMEFDYKIMVKKSVLKDILTDPNYNYGLPMKLPMKPLQKLEIPKF